MRSNFQKALVDVEAWLWENAHTLGERPETYNTLSTTPVGTPVKAPLVFKAILKALRTTFSDFTESFNSPARIAMLLLFCLSGLALPVVKAVSSLATAYLGPDPLARLHGLHLHEDDDQEACEVVVLNGGKARGASWANRLRRLPGRMAGRDSRLTLSALTEGEAYDSDSGTLWASVKLGDDSAHGAL